MRLRSAAIATGRVGAMSAASILLASIAVGWMYWLRALSASWPGPRISNALPLDALPLHDSVPLVVFAVTMAVAALVAGLLARLLDFDGLAIALWIGAGVGAWLYFASAISIFVVNQVSLDEAFDMTRGLEPVYLTALLFALATVLVARRTKNEAWLTRLVPALVGLLGIVSLLIATLPPTVAEDRILGGLLIGPSSWVTHALEVVFGMVLVACARGLGRRSRRALLFAIVFAAAFLVARVVDGLSVVATVVGAVVLLVLVARRGDFAYAGDPTTRASGVVRAVSLVVVAFVYGVAALLVNRVAVGQPFRFVSAVRNTWYSLVGSPKGAALLPSGFGEWFPWSLRAIVVLGIGWGALTLFAPWRHRPVGAPRDRLQARELVDAWGSDSLAPFTLRHDKAHWFYPDRPDEGVATTLLAYRIVRGVALVSGDPIGPGEQASAAVAAFRAWCAERGWRVALLGASDRMLESYREAGLHPYYHGDEAVIDVGTFALGGGALKSVRQAVHRLARKGYTTEIRTGSELGAAARAELVELEQHWLAGGKRKGFVMELDELFRLDGDDALFVIGRDPQRALVGFLEIAICHADSSLSLSSMPRVESAPNGLNASLIVAAVDWARVEGYGALSLNFSPAARLFDRSAPVVGWRRVARSVLMVIKRVLGLQLDNLLLFNKQFRPRWQPRYIVVERLRHVPRVVVAAMAAERYLPFADLLRGRDWEIPSGEAESAVRAAPGR